MSTSIRWACIALLASIGTSAAQAESFASSASSASSASVGSLSDSVKGSSNSSAGQNKVAQGDYRIIEIAPLPERATLVQLKLEGEEGASFTLDLPRETLAREGLAVGQVVAVRHRAYGLEFARGDTRQAFFLALADDWMRELEPQPVKL